MFDPDHARCQTVKTSARSIVASALGIDPSSLSDEDDQDSVQEWDSAGVLMIASMIEITYEVALDEDDVDRLTTIKDVAAVIDRRAVDTTKE